MTQTRPPLIDPDRLPHRALRDAEVYLKRRTFAVENAAVLRLQALYREAYRDLRDVLDTAPNRAMLTGAVNARVERLRGDVLATVERAAKAALVGNYFGRVWLLDMATREDVRVRVPFLTPDKLQETALREDYYDSLIRDLLGKQWREAYEVELEDLTLQIRRAIGNGMMNGEGMDEIARRVRSAMGVETDRRKGKAGSAERATYRQNFNRVQAMTRTVVQSVANQGAVEAYRANADILAGYEILVARDERVCDICRGYDGKKVKLNSSFRPPFHPNCRCGIAPVLKAEALTDPQPAPRTTFKKWSAGFGMDSVLNDFLR